MAKRHWSQIAGLPILSTTDSAHVGFLTGVFLDPEKAKVLAFRASLGKVLSPMDIQAWHSNRIEIFDEEVLVPPSDISRLALFGLKRALLHTKKVRTKSGLSFGRIRDFCLDAQAGTLLSIEVSKRFLLWEWDFRTFSATDIQEITEDSIILNVDPEQKTKVKNKVSAGEKSTVRLSPVSTSEAN